MKKLILFTAAFAMLSFTVSEPNIPRHDNPDSIAVFQDNNDKEFLLAYFEKTANNLHESVKGLNKAQMQFKPTEDSWSVSQCLEHIIMTEKMLFGMAKELLAQPANPERKKEVKITDEELIAGMTDRSTKVTAPMELQPEGKYNTPKAAMEDLKKQRSEILALLDTTTLENLRTHINDSPFGPVDAYHSLLYIAGHTERHTKQIEEVKAHKEFPAE